MKRLKDYSKSSYLYLKKPIIQNEKKALDVNLIALKKSLNFSLIRQIAYNIFNITNTIKNIENKEYIKN
jgi:hypothetical protein